MANHSLKYSNDRNQAVFSKEREKLMQYDLILFVDDIIREYGNAQDNTFYLSVSSLPFDIQKLFLIYLIPIEDYEYYLERPPILIEVIKEYSTDMQNIIDDRCDEVYREDMEEMGLSLRHHRDNNEIYYSRY